MGEEKEQEKKPDEKAPETNAKKTPVEPPDYIEKKFAGMPLIKKPAPAR